MTLVQLTTATAVGIACLQGVAAIDTVDELIVDKYLGRWYQAYGNAFTAQTITRDSTCIAADYGLDEATGNITVINSDRELIPTGELNTITGYAYGVNELEPGQLKVHLGQVPQDGDYWIVGLGPATFGPDEAYEWAIVSGPEALTLFILVRDVPRFDEMYAKEVLALVEDLGFTGPMKKPQRIVQEGCLPFDPNITPSGTEETPEWVDFLLQTAPGGGDVGHVQGVRGFLGAQAVQDLREERNDFVPKFWWEPVRTVAALDVDRYTGRWYQAYSSLTVNVLLEQNGACVTADYAMQEDGTMSVLNTASAGGVDGEFIEMGGYAYYKNESEPGKLTVHLDGVPYDAPYWVLALGDEDVDGLYSWSIVSDPLRFFLFVLVRDPEAFFGSQDETNVLALCKDLGFTSFWNTPKETIQEGCVYPSNPTLVQGEEKGVGTLVVHDHNKDHIGFMQKFLEPVKTVAALDVDRYTGRWYQAYSSLTVNVLLEQNGACVTADYAAQENGTVSVLNTARAGGVDGELNERSGYAYYKNESEPGKLTVHLDGVPYDAPYWVLALGDEDVDGLYSWSIVSDPLRFFLFVLVRDPEAFFGSQDETNVLALCKDLGFTSFWNTPKETIQEGCVYPSNPTLVQGEEEVMPKIMPKLNLRRKLGLGAPLHASCKMTIKFPEDTCENVIETLVSAAEVMAGFDKCDGGNKCGYTVSKVTYDSIALVHETSVLHYKDDLTFTFTEEGNSCEAAAFSTSQTWYAVLDNSVNYCNLHNLVEATGLMYEEVDVSDETCTQFSSADCERY